MSFLSPDTSPQENDNFWDDHNTHQLEITLDTFEGPLSLLLHLAQEQRVDLTLISLSTIVSQYLLFVKNNPNLEHCAHHLRMASYLTWLKSRRLLPKPLNDDLPSPEEEEALLLQKLQHLKAIRDAADTLMKRPQAGRDFWNCEPSPTTTPREIPTWPELTQLLASYGRVLVRKTTTPLKVIASKLYDTRRVLPLIRQKLFAPSIPQWMPLSHLIPAPEEQDQILHRRSALSATFLAVLTLLNQGEADAKQSSILAPLYIIAKHNKNTHS